MPVLKNLRFNKFDKYDNPVFIASHKEKENYDDLKNKANKLEAKNLHTFLPIYHSEKFKFATIRFVKNFQKNGDYIKPQSDCVYNIDYSIKTKTKESPNASTRLGAPLGGKASDGATIGDHEEGRTYVNCYINTITFVKKLDRSDGDELEL